MNETNPTKKTTKANYSIGTRLALLAGAAAAFPLAGSADVVYTNVNPPQTASVDPSATTDTFDSISVVMDPNATDGSTTFVFNAEENPQGWESIGPPYSKVYVTPPTNGHYVIISGADQDPKALSAGAMIGPGSLFSTGGDGTLSKTSAYPPFDDYPWPNDITQFRYLGVEFQDSAIGAGTFYGWVSVSAETDASVTVNGFAFNNTPNACISAGQTSGMCSVTPEPSSLALLALGAAGLAALRTRRRSRRA